MNILNADLIPELDGWIIDLQMTVTDAEFDGENAVARIMGEIYEAITAEIDATKEPISDWCNCHGYPEEGQA